MGSKRNVKQLERLFVEWLRPKPKVQKLSIKEMFAFDEAGYGRKNWNGPSGEPGYTDAQAQDKADMAAWYAQNANAQYAPDDPNSPENRRKARQAKAAALAAQEDPDEFPVDAATHPLLAAEKERNSAQMTAPNEISLDGKFFNDNDSAEQYLQQKAKDRADFMKRDKAAARSKARRGY